MTWSGCGSCRSNSAELHPGDGTRSMAPAPAGSGRRRHRQPLDPLDNLRGYVGGHGLRDGAVFCRVSGDGVLEEVVEAGELGDEGAFVAGFVQGGADGGEVDVGEDLEVEAAVEGEDGDLRALQDGDGVVGDEEAPPW